MTRLAVGDVEQLRAVSAPIPSGIAPVTSSEHFKSPLSKSKPISKTLKHHMSLESRAFGSSLFKTSAALDDSQKVIRMGVGRPNANLYPWNSATFGLSQSARAVETADGKQVSRQHNGLDVETALNYGNAMGSPYLVRFLTEHVEIVHDPPFRDWNVCLTCGSTSSMEIALRMFCNAGETVLSEEFTYPGFSEVAKVVGVSVQGVTMDCDGLRSDTLDAILNTWDSSQGGKPSLLYVIPTGQNPTGCTMPSERRKAIYEVAEKHDLIIIEDDPYFFLSLEPFIDGAKTNDVDGQTDYYSSLLPSFLSIDLSGRVVRLDSFSKIFCPGLRAGWVTASSRIIDKFIAYNETDAITASGPSQLMLCGLLENSWGHRGFFSWLADLSRAYSRRRDIVERALQKYLSQELCNWTKPRYGMFLWLRLDLNKHPNFQCESDQPREYFTAQVSDIEARISIDALENGVQITKGSLFAVDSQPRNEVHLRVTYAAASESDLEKGVRVLAESIMREFQIVRA
jgi:aromatic amino acid aminotransferase I